ncbi:tetratricopeptide repeat protein [Nitratireductor mangrovi]|uniref:Tetratricopeptide repeat protein n=1 Tax=Nitratireductor mangrovi TaxID=2599600 RepID=A0A5B8KWA5_9HYPH|nr:tetratricopeptide repeat protein [Nitratireductor mangrovi]QDY99996.1 tetratricopeptide repeat protein [Nitratireductor mangrovi]
MRLAIALVLAIAAGITTAAAQDADALSEERARLFAELESAPTEQQGRAVEDAIWRLWMAEAPTAAIRRDVAEAMSARDGYDFARARDILDEVVRAAPGYAEGWNQRAFIHFLQGNLDESLQDIDHALELEPKHFAALAGKAIILMQQGRPRLAQEALRRAVGIHPWLKERSMLLPEPPGPVGEDI